MTSAEKIESKQTIDRIHKKHYGSQPTKAQQENGKITKAIKDRSPIAQVNEKLAEEGLPIIQFATKKDAQVPAGEANATEVGISDHPTRAQLMKAAQTQGIKYFRILSREELREVLQLHIKGGTVPSGKTMKEIIDQAKARWKNGWGSKKKGAQNL